VSMCRSYGSFLYTARTLARLGLINRRYETQCPCCGEQGEGETVEHLKIILRYDKWAGQRDQHMGTMLEGVGQEDGNAVCTIMLGGGAHGDPT
jgi:hypothetical protein